MYFEFYDWDTLIVRGDERDILNDIEWTEELMAYPSFNLTLPITYKEYLKGREEFKLRFSDKVFWGIVKDIVINKPEETIDLRIDHVVSEWEYRQISVNNAVIDDRVDIVFKGDEVVRSKNNDEAITANDFTINTKDVPKITDAKLIEKAFAQAWSPSNGDRLKVKVSDKGGLKKKEGEYKIKFSAPKGTTVTVTCTVKANINLGTKRSKTNKSTDPKEIVTAHNFTIDIGEVEAGLTDAEILKISKAEAHVYHKPKKKITGLTVAGTVRAETDDYVIGIVTPKGTRVNITVRVEELTTPSYADLPASVVDKLSDIYNDMNFAYPGWELDWQDDSGKRTIDYVYSRQNKLEALTKTIELTPDLWWRVGYTDEKKIEIGKFGQKKNYKITVDPPGETNIQMLDEPTIHYDFEHVINVATVYSEKSDTGMSSMTLREIYENPELQDPDFPVVILRANVNNERNYERYITQFPKLGPNGLLEYAVLDVPSIKAEAGYLVEGTRSFTDLAPTNTESKKVTDEQRRKAPTKAYHATIRWLKQSRRAYPIDIPVSQFPSDVRVGDRVRLIYDNYLYVIGECSNYYKKILTRNDWFYVQSIRRRITTGGPGEPIETADITLTKQLKLEREVQEQW